MHIGAKERRSTVREVDIVAFLFFFLNGSVLVQGDFLLSLVIGWAGDFISSLGAGLLWFLFADFF